MVILIVVVMALLMVAKRWRGMAAQAVKGKNRVRHGVIVGCGLDSDLVQIAD